MEACTGGANPCMTKKTAFLVSWPAGVAWTDRARKAQ